MPSSASIEPGSAPSPAWRSPSGGEARRHGRDVEVLRLGGRELVPGHRRRHRRARRRADGVGGGDEELPVVDVHARAAVALEPRRRGRGRHPPDELAGQRRLRAGHFVPAPARLDRHRHVHAAAARRLREAAQAVLGEQAAQLGGHRGGLAEAGPRLRIEVEPQLVGVAGIRAADRRGMEAQRAQARRPCDHRELGRVDPVLAGRDPVRPPLRDPPLEDRLAAARRPASARASSAGRARRRGCRRRPRGSSARRRPSSGSPPGSTACRGS